VLTQNLERLGKITENLTRRISNRDQIYTKVDRNEFVWLKKEFITDTCDHVTAPSHFVRGGIIFDEPRNYQLVKKDSVSGVKCGGIFTSFCSRLLSFGFSVLSLHVKEWKGLLGSLLRLFGLFCLTASSLHLFCESAVTMPSNCSP
jgi:hypothetical protein